MSKEVNQSELFYNTIVELLKNLMINSPNYKNGHYNTSDGVTRLIEDTSNKAIYVLCKMKESRHLIGLD